LAIRDPESPTLSAIFSPAQTGLSSSRLIGRGDLRFVIHRHWAGRLQLWLPVRAVQRLVVVGGAQKIRAMTRRTCAWPFIWRHTV